MKLELISSENRLVHIESSGSITLMDVQEQTPLAEFLGPDGFRNRILLKLDKTPYIDTGAVSWFIQVHKACKQAGGCLVLHSIPPLVLQILELLRMNKVLNLAEDETQARAMAQGAQP